MGHLCTNEELLFHNRELTGLAGSFSADIFRLYIWEDFLFYSPMSQRLSAKFMKLRSCGKVYVQEKPSETQAFNCPTRCYARAMANAHFDAHKKT
jgi:hypothetical protein